MESLLHFRNEPLELRPLEHLQNNRTVSFSDGMSKRNHIPAHLDLTLMINGVISREIGSDITQNCIHRPFIHIV